MKFISRIYNLLRGNADDPRLVILDNLYGSRRSVDARLAIDKRGRPLPWLTYPAIDFLDRLDFSNANFFEFGCGYGTLYWKQKCKSITSVEDNKEWYELILKKTLRSEKVKITYCQTRDRYINSIKATAKKYDVIIVDGVHRDGCVINAMSSLKSGGMIILDNSDWYANSAQLLRNAGYIQIDFDGFGPANNFTWVTSIFFKSLKFKHTSNIKKNYSKGGYKKVVVSK